MIEFLGVYGLYKTWSSVFTRMHNWKEFSSDKPQEEFREGWAASHCRRYCGNSCHEPNNIKVKNPQRTDHCKIQVYKLQLQAQTQHTWPARDTCWIWILETNNHSFVSGPVWWCNSAYNNQEWWNKIENCSCKVCLKSYARFWWTSRRISFESPPKELGSTVSAFFPAHVARVRQLSTYESCITTEQDLQHSRIALQWTTLGCAPGSISLHIIMHF